MNRRSLLASALVVFAGQRLPFPDWMGSAAAEGAKHVWRHGLAKFGELKYPAGFKQFDYVNPNAPKTGAASQISLGTFDNFNPVVAGVKGTLVQGIDFVFDTLLTSALDEVSSVYGLLAESVSFPEDLSSVTFRLRPEAKWQDGKPVTADDVIFSFNAYKKVSPQAAANYRHVVKAEKTGDNDVTFVLDGTASHELPIIIGQLTVMPKHWWEGSDKDGRKRSIEETTLEMPLGSGPYKIKEFSPAHAIVYERVKDYWGTNVNVNVGRNNFDELRFEYFRDATVAVEAFKGDLVDWRTENSAKNWSTAYDFPAVTEKRVILQEFPITNVGVMQAFAFNLRRNKFKDPRVRQAFNYLFDFEEMNKKIFFGQYKRTGSYFEGTELAATGVPTGRELELLETVRDKVPPELFTKPMPTRSTASRMPCATTCERLCGFSKRPATKYAISRSSMRRPASLSKSNFSPMRRSSNASSCSTSRLLNGSASRCQSARSIRRSTRTGCANGTSTLLRLRGVNRSSPETSSAATGVRRRPINPDRTTFSASRILRSMR